MPPKRKPNTKGLLASVRKKQAIRNMTRVMRNAKNPVRQKQLQNAATKIQRAYRNYRSGIDKLTSNLMKSSKNSAAKRERAQEMQVKRVVKEMMNRLVATNNFNLANDFIVNEELMRVVNNNNVNALLENIFNNRRNIPTKTLTRALNNSNSNSNNNSNRRRIHNNRKLNNNSAVNGRLSKGDRSMKVSRKSFGKYGRQGTKGRYNSKTSCHRLPIDAVRELATKRGLTINRSRGLASVRSGPHSSSRPSLCRQIYGFEKLFKMARHMGIRKTKRLGGRYHPGYRKYKTVDEIHNEIEEKLAKDKAVTKSMSYDEIMNRGLAKGKLHGGNRPLGSLNN